MISKVFVILVKDYARIVRHKPLVVLNVSLEGIFWIVNAYKLVLINSMARMDFASHAIPVV